jgi:putative spermidine/putrescine transport system ATP-binding protein
MIQLSIQNLTKRYKTGEGVSNISLDVKKGELVTLLGPSGCGKTTVLRSIGGFLEPDSGDIRIEGKSVLKLPPEKRPTGMVFQGYNLWPHMNVYNNLAFGLKIRKKNNNEIEQAVKRVLDLVRLPGSQKKFPSELSGGQQQRVAVARAFLLEPAVLLLDEPFSALDAKLRHEMREELRDIQSATGLTMVFVTHDQEEALSISDQIVVMNSGLVEQIATPQEIYDHPRSLFVAQFIGKMNFIKGRVDGNKVYVKHLEFPNTQNLEGDVTVAVRPEDISLKPDNGLPATIRQVMVLGHYAEVSFDTESGLIKAFLPRDSVKDLVPGQSAGLSFSKVLSYKTI